MGQPTSVLTLILWLSGNLAFFAIILLVLRSAAKLQWLTAICLSVLATTSFSILGLRFFPGPVPKVGMIILFLAVVCAIILIIQFFRWLLSSDNASVNAAERDKILKMVEEGKINTEEGTELLDAIGRSSALRGEEKFSRLDMTMLLGVAMVVLGFFLPWVHLHRGLYQSGPNVGAIGWAVLIVGILSVIPIFITPKNFLYKISMLQIFLNLTGIALVVSLLVRVGENLGAGLIFCLAGFTVEIFSAIVKFKKLAA